MVCIKSHMERCTVPAIAAPFQPMKIGPVRVVNRRVCDRWEVMRP